MDDNRLIGEKRLIYEYSVLRYVPDVEREEFLNIGLMMMCKRSRWLRIKVEIDEKRLKCLNPSCDTERLRVQTGIFKETGIPRDGLPVEERYRWLAAVKSAIIQTSESHPGILLCRDEDSVDAVEEILEDKFMELFRRLVN